MSPKRKSAAERQTLPVTYRAIPYFAVEVVDVPNLSGIRGVGESPFAALINMRAEVRRRYPASAYDLDENLTGLPGIESRDTP